MTTAELAPVSGNATAVFFSMTVLIAFILGSLLWRAEGDIVRLQDTVREQSRQIGLLTAGLEALTAHLGLQINEPIVDDSPAAMAERCDAPRPEGGTHCLLIPGHSSLHMDLFDRTWANEMAPLAVVSVADPEADTDEFPTVPSTVPDGMPLAVQSALIAERPTPAPRNIAEPEPVFVERRVNIGGTVQTFRIRAPEGRK